MSAISGRDRVSATLEAKEGIGDSLAIALSPIDDGGFAFWAITVDAETEGDDLIRVGSIVVPPKAPTEVRGPRAVAGAYFPGVKRWHVEAIAHGKPGPFVYGTTIALSGGRERTTIAAPSCVGVWSITSDGEDVPCAPALLRGVWDIQSTFAASPAWLVGAHGSNPSGIVLFAQVHDSDVALVGGEVPADEVLATPASPWVLPAPSPRRLTKGLTLALSTTPGTFTAAATTGQLAAAFRYIRGPF